MSRLRFGELRLGVLTALKKGLRWDFQKPSKRGATNSKVQKSLAKIAFPPNVEKLGILGRKWAPK